MENTMNTITQTSNKTFFKSGSVKAMQIITLIRLALVMVFYIVFTVKDITIGTVGPQIILYTFFAFSLTAAAIFYFINRRNLLALRITLLVDLLAAIPASAFISILLSVITFGLSFTKSAKAYFLGA